MAEVAGIELDLAFSTEPDLAAELLVNAGPWSPAPGDQEHTTARLDACEQAWQHLLTGWLSTLQGELPPELQSSSYSLGLSLVGDAEIAALNQDWRHKAGPTDVLAFAAMDEPENGTPSLPMPGVPLELALELGDIVISLETAARQAPKHGNSLEQELLFLASHGLLHLLGWDHPDEASLAAMLQRQAALCSSVNVQPSGSPHVHP